MKLTNDGTGSKLWSAVLCGVLSVFVDFILIPQVCRPAILGFSVPDPIWMSMMIFLPVLVAIHMLEKKAHIPARYVWAGLPVQYLILIVFAKLISRIGHWGDWTYIWDAMVWPLSVTAAQFVSLIVLRKWKAKRRK